MRFDFGSVEPRNDCRGFGIVQVAVAAGSCTTAPNAAFGARHPSVPIDTDILQGGRQILGQLFIADYVISNDLAIDRLEWPVVMKFQWH